MKADHQKPSGTPYRFLFGPVLSRRLGRSLGVDLVPAKTCTEGCLFCEAGPTTRLTLAREEYVPTAEVISEVRDWLRRGGTADSITLSGAGEPTLHSRFGDVLTAVREACPIRTVLLSNGTLFWLAEVREAACRAHVVKVSLSAWDQASFQRINRPHPDLHFATVVEGLRAFRGEFAGQLWLEVFALRGLNDAPDAMRRIAAIAAEFAPDRVQLNTVARPPADAAAQAVETERLQALAEWFGPRAEAIADVRRTCDESGDAVEEDILGLLRRRGCTLEQLAGGLGAAPVRVAAGLQPLLARGVVREERRGEERYYVLTKAEAKEERNA